MGHSSSRKPIQPVYHMAPAALNGSLRCAIPLFLPYSPTALHLAIHQTNTVALYLDNVSSILRTLGLNVFENFKQHNDLMHSD
jgi:hypothetical protein